MQGKAVGSMSNFFIHRIEASISLAWFVSVRVANRRHESEGSSRKGKLLLRLFRRFS